MGKKYHNNMAAKYINLKIHTHLLKLLFSADFRSAKNKKKKVFISLLTKNRTEMDARCPKINKFLGNGLESLIMSPEDHEGVERTGSKDQETQIQVGGSVYLLEINPTS